MEKIKFHEIRSPFNALQHFRDRHFCTIISFDQFRHFHDQIRSLFFRKSLKYERRKYFVDDTKQT